MDFIVQAAFYLFVAFAGCIIWEDTLTPKDSRRSESLAGDD